jgi:hypothetical protein
VHYHRIFSFASVSTDVSFCNGKGVKSLPFYLPSDDSVCSNDTPFLFGYHGEMRIASLTFIAVVLCLSSLAYASLGGDITSVQNDAKSLGAKNSALEFKTYSRHEISNQWLQTHQFMGADGKVFALTWRGSRHPQMESLLGNYFKDFQGAVAQAKRQSHHGGATIVEYGNLHLEIGGHMRSVYGKVWLTDQLPSGMDVHEIQ